MKHTKILSLLLSILLILSILSGCGVSEVVPEGNTQTGTVQTPTTTPNTNLGSEKELLASNYEGEPFMHINDGVPYFTDEEKSQTKVFEKYSDLDKLGRCGVASACLGKELMPTEDRESLSSVTPSGWKNKQYDSKLVDGGWIYNRAHIIGFQLAGEQANEKNLITGTRYFNVDGMLTFENMVADYIKETNNKVLYRVTPIYSGNNLVAEGVLMEGWSIEDNGDGICFNVFVFNVQPGIEINYATGDNWLADEKETASGTVTPNPTDDCVKEEYILNTNSKKYHKPSCSGAQSISEKNKKEYIGTKEDLEKQGYDACGICKP